MNTFKNAEILLPKNVDMNKWSVVACDQYTSEPEYWEQVKKNVGDSPSTLNLIFPEAMLGTDKEQDRISAINSTMDKYLNEGIFNTYEDALILVERTQRDGRKRQSIVGTVDLEDYDFTKGSTSKIRATEGTVLSRIPPRVKIREGASLELPHIIMLIDDIKKTVIEPLNTASCDKLYDFELMMSSGHLSGWKLDDASKSHVYDSLSKLSDIDEFHKKYKTDKELLLFCVGDGNHSLATAKTCWENIKPTLSKEEQCTHPARFALVEIMNIHSEALEFEPIHRVLTDVDQKLFYTGLQEYERKLTGENPPQEISILMGDKEIKVTFKHPTSKLPVGTIQMFIDDYLSKNPGSVDYVHGDAVVRELSKKGNSIGIILPPMDKEMLFPTIIFDGVLPRKTFSMGEAHDKKFYLEAKKIK